MRFLDDWLHNASARDRYGYRVDYMYVYPNIPGIKSNN
jgi:hypothetical protein